MATILEESGFDPNKELKIVGTNPVKHDGLDKVTGRAKFGADLHVPGMLVGKVLRSPHPHAVIRSIDTSKAEALPGVKAVITPADAKGVVIGINQPLLPADFLEIRLTRCQRRWQVSRPQR